MRFHYYEIKKDSLQPGIFLKLGRQMPNYIIAQYFIKLKNRSNLCFGPCYPWINLIGLNGIGWW